LTRLLDSKPHRRRADCASFAPAVELRTRFLSDSCDSVHRTGDGRTPDVAVDLGDDCAELGFVFAGLTVYDAQRLTLMAREAPAERLSSYALVGALALYLDFMNLFLFLLRFTGNRRQNDASDASRLE